MPDRLAVNDDKGAIQSYKPTFPLHIVRVTDRRQGCVLCVGHSRETIDGHWQCMMGLPQVRGYNGEFGYRRNSPRLRRQPSSFDLVEDATSRSTSRATSTRA